VTKRPEEAAQTERERERPCALAFGKQVKTLP
jgi:hypothetical protein